MSYEQVEIDVIRWSEARGIIPNSTPAAQLLKTFEEMGELASATVKGRLWEAKDAVGDVMVCLINYCALQDIDLVSCLKQAYNEIKERRGQMMPGGVFVKEEIDFPEEDMTGYEVGPSGKYIGPSIFEVMQEEKNASMRSRLDEMGSVPDKVAAT